MAIAGKVNADTFYGEYHGHRVKDLQILLPYLRNSSPNGLIWTAGDSSLDNKFWFHQISSAVGAYADVLDPPQSNCDITFWMNQISEQQHAAASSDENKMEWIHMATINTAVEATTLNERSFALRSQDKFLCENIRNEDVLIVSVGGNDVAMAPTPCTILSMAGLLCLPSPIIEHGFTCCSVPVDDYCCGCGPSLLSCAGTCPPCAGYFIHLFKTRLTKYIEALTSKHRPKTILVCMIYYLDENSNASSWANPALSAMGYNTNPSKLQLFIRKIFEFATSHIQIRGSNIVPVPLFHVLDGKQSQDYIARVEPSAIGGRKVATYLLDIIQHEHFLPPKKSEASICNPKSELMNDRFG